MEESKRKQKQVLIAVIFFVILGSIGYLIYLGVRPPQTVVTVNPTSTLAPVQVVYSKLFNIQNNDYDFLVKVNNPNTDYGSGNVVYDLTFYNGAGSQISTRTGSFYILPGQTKYVVVTPLKFQEPISRAQITIKSIDWQKLDPLAANGVNLFVRNASYAQINQSGVFAKAGGSILNNSDLDINLVNVIVVAYDQDGAPVAVNQTSINTFLSHTSRGFEVSWFVPFTGAVSRVDAEANTNIFEDSDFLRTYGGGERFKQLY